MGAAQRFLFRDQRLTPEGATGDKRVSDLLLFGSGSLWQNRTSTPTLQYGAAIDQPVRSIVACARDQPSPFHTLAGTYRYARGLNEQFQLGWQWPLTAGPDAARCRWMPGNPHGVGRTNYNMRDNRITDSPAGIEYDAGCWIGRVVAERVSTGRTERPLG